MEVHDEQHPLAAVRRCGRPGRERGRGHPGATIERTESDAGGVYESHIRTADGERLTVLVGEDFTVTGTETGGPGGRGGPGGADCPEDDAAAGTTADRGTGDPGTSESPAAGAPDSSDGSGS